MESLDSLDKAAKVLRYLKSFREDVGQQAPPGVKEHLEGLIVSAHAEFCRKLLEFGPR